jgi:hypothetical protein
MKGSDTKKVALAPRSRPLPARKSLGFGTLHAHGTGAAPHFDRYF